MALVIAVVLSACSNHTMADAAKRMQEIQKAYPNAKVTVRVDKKCLKTGADLKWE